MTLKRKSQCVAGAFVVAFVALVLWPVEEQPEARIFFSGVSATDSNRVSFTVSNPSSAQVEYQLAVRHYGDGGVCR